MVLPAYIPLEKKQAWSGNLCRLGRYNRQSRETLRLRKRDFPSTPVRSGTRKVNVTGLLVPKHPVVVERQVRQPSTSYQTLKSLGNWVGLDNKSVNLLVPSVPRQADPVSDTDSNSAQGVLAPFPQPLSDPCQGYPSPGPLGHYLTLFWNPHLHTSHPPENGNVNWH